MTIDYSRIMESSRKLLNVVLKSGLEVKTPDGRQITTDNINQILNEYNEEKSEDLVNFINSIITKLNCMTETRAEAILLKGNCNEIDQCEKISGANYEKQMHTVINKLYEMCTSGNYRWTLPNGNTYTPNNVPDSVKLMIKSHLNDEADRFRLSYNDFPEQFENKLENHLSNYLMNCGLKSMFAEINEWNTFIKECSCIFDDAGFASLKDLARKVLYKAIKLNTIIIIDDKKITSQNDIDSLLEEYDKDDSEYLIDLVNTLNGTICQWKTVLQKLIDNDYNKNEINITTVSFDEIDCKKMFTEEKLLECYNNNEVYEEHFISDVDFEKRTDKIIGDFDLIKSQLILATRALCRSNKVKFTPEEFEEIFEKSKQFIKKEGFKIVRGWMPGLTIKFRPNELFKTFIKHYQKTCATLISQKINSNN